MFVRAIHRKLGTRGLVVVLVLFAVAGFYGSYPQIREHAPTLPGLARFFEPPIPVADPDRYSVAVADLVDDDARVIKEVLLHGIFEIEGLQRLDVPRTVEFDAALPREEAIREGETRAHELLASSKASVLLWGSVIGPPDRRVPVLYWTPSVAAEWRTSPER